MHEWLQSWKMFLVSLINHVEIVYYSFLQKAFFLCVDSPEEQPPQPSRRKKGCPEKWKRNLAKKKVETGQTRVTKKRKRDITAIQFKVQIFCKCKTNCSIKIHVARQKALFKAYYENSNHTQKVLTVVPSVMSLLEVHNNRRRYFPIHKSTSPRTGNLTKSFSWLCQNRTGGKA